MTMTYSELTTHLQDKLENTFESAQLAVFFRQAEQKIFNEVQLPALRKNVTGDTTPSDEYLRVPSDFLYPFSMAVDNGGTYQYLLNKDSNFIREAYPNADSTGVPRVYAIFDECNFILGPTPDDEYTIELHYAAYPESIVDSDSTPTWLSREYDQVLLDAAIMEAYRFMKGDQQIMEQYAKAYAQSMAELKNLGAAKLRQDVYRSGQVDREVQ